MSPTTAVLDFTAGTLLSLLFYGGLWMTVRALTYARHPAALVLGSVVFRTLAVLSGLVLVAQGHWQDALTCFAGFVLGRIPVSRYLLKCT